MSTSLEWLSRAMEWTLRNSLDGTILFLVVAVILFVFRFRLAPQLKIGLLLLVAVRFFLPMAPESSWSLKGMIPSFQMTESRAASENLRLPTSDKEWRGDRPAVKTREVESFAASQGANPESKWTGRVLPVIWISGIFCVLLIAGIQWGFASRRIQSLPVYDEEEGLRLLRRVAFPQRIRIVEAASGEGVAVFGLFRVTHLVLPKRFVENYGREGATGILRHEMEHIRGNDLLRNWIVLLLQSWHWFNPAVWIAGRLYQNEREILCDRSALQNENAQVRQTYGSTLIKALEAGRFHEATPSMISFVTRKNELKQRLELIMKNKPYHMFLQLSVIAVIAAFSLASFTSPAVIAADEEGKKAPEAERDGDREREAGPRDGDGKKAGPRDGEGKKEGPRDGDKPKAEGEGKDRAPARGAAMNTKEGKVFTTYDKDKDGFVTADEIADMKEGKQNSRARREFRKAVKRADKDEDGKLNFEEFKFWYNIGRLDEDAEFR